MLKRLPLVLSFLGLGLVTPSIAGVIYASNFGNNTITRYDSGSGALLGTISTPEVTGVAGVRLGPGGNLYVLGSLSNNLARYNAATGALVGVLDSANAAGLDTPPGMAFGPDGLLYVASAQNDRIVRFDPATGNYVDVFATVDSGGHNGPITPGFAGSYLYVSGFDSGSLLQLDGTTGALLNTTPGPPGFGLGDLAIGPDGNVYVGTVDFSDFTGGVLRFSGTTGAFLGTFIPYGTGGLGSPGGIAFGHDGYLYVANLVFDQNLNDAGSTILRFDATTGAFVNQLVGPGQGLNAPFFLDASVAVAVPEPPALLTLPGALALLFPWLRRKRCA